MNREEALKIYCWRRLGVSYKWLSEYELQKIDGSLSFNMWLLSLCVEELISSIKYTITGWFK